MHRALSTLTSIAILALLTIPLILGLVPATISTQSFDVRKPQPVVPPVEPVPPIEEPKKPGKDFVIELKERLINASSYMGIEKAKAIYRELVKNVYELQKIEPVKAWRKIYVSELELPLATYRITYVYEDGKPTVVLLYKPNETIYIHLVDPETATIGKSVALTTVSDELEEASLFKHGDYLYVILETKSPPRTRIYAVKWSTLTVDYKQQLDPELRSYTVYGDKLILFLSYSGTDYILVLSLPDLKIVASKSFNKIVDWDFDWKRDYLYVWSIEGSSHYMNVLKIYNLSMVSKFPLNEVKNYSWGYFWVWEEAQPDLYILSLYYSDANHHSHIIEYNVYDVNNPELLFHLIDMHNLWISKYGRMVWNATGIYLYRHKPAGLAWSYEPGTAILIAAYNYGKERLFLARLGSSSGEYVLELFKPVTPLEFEKLADRTLDLGPDLRPDLDGISSWMAPEDAYSAAVSIYNASSRRYLRIEFLDDELNPVKSYDVSSFGVEHVWWFDGVKAYVVHGWPYDLLIDTSNDKVYAYRITSSHWIWYREPCGAFILCYNGTDGIDFVYTDWYSISFVEKGVKPSKPVEGLGSRGVSVKVVDGYAYVHTFSVWRLSNRDMAILFLGYRGEVAVTKGIELTVVGSNVKEAAPGERVEFKLRAKNTGEESSRYRVAIVEGPRWRVDISPKEFSLRPAASQEIRLTVYVPSDATEGEYVFKVKVYSIEDPSVYDVAELKVVVKKPTVVSIKMMPRYEDISAYPGDRVYAYAIVKNMMQNDRIRARIYVENVPEGVRVSPTPSSVVVAPGREYRIRLYIAIGPTTKPGSYDVKVCAKATALRTRVSGEDCTVMHLTVLTPKAEYRIRVYPSNVRVIPPRYGYVTLVIRNIGRAIDRAVVAIEPLEGKGWSIRPENRTIVAYPGRVYYVRFYIMANGVPPGTYEFRAYVKSLYGTAYAETMFRVSVEYRYGVDVKALTKNVVCAPGDTCILKFSIKNIGRYRDIYRITVDVDGLKLVSPPPRTITLGPGAVQIVELGVEVPKTAKLGKIYRVTLTATSSRGRLSDSDYAEVLAMKPKIEVVEEPPPQISDVEEGNVVTLKFVLNVIGVKHLYLGIDMVFEKVVDVSNVKVFVNGVEKPVLVEVSDSYHEELKKLIVKVSLDLTNVTNEIEVRVDLVPTVVPTTIVWSYTALDLDREIVVTNVDATILGEKYV